MAVRNRTLKLSDDDVRELERNIIVPDKNDVGHNYENAVINGDIFNVIHSLPDSFADLIIIDPPYNLTKDFHGMKFSSMSTADYETYIDSWLSYVCRKLKPAGTLYMCGDWKCSSAMQRAIERELTIMNRITWQREKGRGAGANWKNTMEDIWFAVKNPDNYYFDVEAVKIKRRVIATYRIDGHAKDWVATSEGNFRTTYPSNFWDDISVPFWSMPENTEHPTQKPEKLYAKLILASSRPNDMVFDPFLGSGTAAVVAKKLGRRYCGVEINRTYCLYAEKRLKMAETYKEIQGYRDKIFWERNSRPPRKSTAASGEENPA